MKFYFEVVETRQGEIVMEASNYDDAVRLANELYHEGAVMWADSSHDLHLERSYE